MAGGEGFDSLHSEAYDFEIGAAGWLQDRSSPVAPSAEMSAALGDDFELLETAEASPEEEPGTENEFEQGPNKRITSGVADKISYEFKRNGDNFLNGFASIGEKEVKTQFDPRTA